MIEQQRVYRIKDLDSLLGLLREDLCWDLPEASIDDVSFEWTGLDLNLSEDVNKKLKGGLIHQLQPFATDQPWGIFVIEFTTREVSIITLRQILRCFFAKRRGARPDLPAWQCENLLFICLYGENGFTFAHFKGDKPYSSKLTTFSWHPGEPIRTVCEFNLPALVYDYTWTPETWVEEWQKAFDVEKVNKDFYRQIARFYYRLTGKEGQKRELVLPYVGDDSGSISIYEEFAVRLIGRSIFCWFLKHKESANDVPLIPPEALSLTAARKTEDFYHSMLEPLFFEVMNKRVSERKSLAIPQSEIIPFLNGGLFEPHPNDYYSNAPNHGLKIPDAWFIDFLGLLERYNFTITENSSIDVDVAVDPEMLGRIFENLLAEVVPETGETARKATGSYYTPRAIVDYMVEQSLRQCLLTKTELGEEKVSRLLDYGEDIEDFSPEEKLAAVTALREIKVIDPACGSGAFLMGILHRMLAVLEKVDPRLELWRAQYLKSLDGIVRQTVEKNISRENWAYIRKLMIIRDSIYGVDIQPIAVEIAKLRCFLSLVVDEIVLDSEDNRGIEPLPNLEFKFVAANTLIGLPEAASQSAFGVTATVEKLKELRESYLRSFGAAKLQIEKEFRATQQKLFKENVQWAVADTLVKQLTEWDPFSYESCGWFDPGWMFGIEYGFDVVIANPPYISAVEHVKSDPIMHSIYRQRYPLIKGAFDVYTVFLLRGNDLCKSNGSYAWIIPNKFLVAGYAKDVLTHLINTGLQASIDVSSFNVFDNTGVYPIILLGNKHRKKSFVNYSVTRIEDLYNREIAIKDTSLIRQFKTFKDFGILIGSGATGFQAQQIVGYLSETQKASAIPFIVSGSIDRYSIDLWNIRYMGKRYKKAFIRKGAGIADSKWSFWIKKKIVIAGMTKKIEAYYAIEPLAIGVGTYAIYDFAGFPPKFLLGILNSKFLSYYLNEKFKDKHLAGGYLAINKTTIEQLPLVDTPLSKQKPIIILVDEILNITKNEGRLSDSAKQSKVKELEHQIDKLVYELYELTVEEIAVVENSIR